jgi:thiamine biosynthesis protein ThiI
LYFESIPYTSELAREKVFTLAKIMTEYCGKIRMHVISLTKIQEAIRDNCDEDYFTLLLRRFMMRLSCRMAEQCGAPALITGESLGQVASQTMAAICVTENASDRPILRPCIGMDKEEIVRTAREIGTFETSILPYEDCCTVFTPRHPKTKPEKEKVMAELQKVDFSSLLDEAYATMYTETRLIFPEYK